MCNHCPPRRWNPDGVCWPPVPSSAMRQFSVWKGISGFQSSFFFCELLIKASANTILLFLKSISNFFFSVNYGWDLLVMALRLLLLIFLKLYICAPMQMRQLCFWGRKDWFKLAENDWFSELAFILSSPLFFPPLFHQHLCVPFVLGWSFQE